MKNILSNLMGINRSLIAMLMLTFALVSCKEKEEEVWSPYKSKATIEYTTLSYIQTSCTGKTSGDPRYKWVLQIVEGESFCYIDQPTGTVGEKFSLTFDKNETSESRKAKITIVFTDGYSNTFTIEQLAKGTNPSYEHMWAEQPEYVSSKDYLYKTYYTTLRNGKRVRNFSVCYDTMKMCSRWVAYPVHTIYTSGRDYETGGSTDGRTNAWAFDDAVTQYKYDSNYNKAYEITSQYVAEIDSYDTFTLPIIPQRRQADIRFTNGFGSGWARGHMLPSANRYNTWNTNAQTCYSTNIMVQAYDFNGGSWATLENKTRGKACSDTLYVVVGTLFEDNKTVSRFDRTIGVPSHCYKLLLRTKRGNTGKCIQDITSADDLMCIGFIFENNSSSKNTSLSSAACSVADIEQRAGISFFRNLNPAIADKVKSQKNYSDWNF